MGQHHNQLKKIRRLAVAMAFGITVLALQSLWTGMAFFQWAALGLTGFTLVFITVMIARAVHDGEPNP